ncbi:hypothetical protein [Rhodococcus qingshengii]|uniref:hypothetical protein n=1 Tax=Rhodococcus qingshengii TaxID=334542 RepID=UPI001BE6C270|nr:hypothetical protein [Rhodococcus qingshengii]MBT2272737.1 hypothetical protein [Rhodococcus qingshengii]
MRTKMKARVIAGATMSAVVLAAGNAAVANAAPELDPQTPGPSNTANLDPQTPTSPTPAAPAPAPAPAPVVEEPPAPRPFYVEPAPEYNPQQWRPAPSQNTQSTPSQNTESVPAQNTAPAEPEQGPLHLPDPTVTPVVPIQAEEGFIRLGDAIAKRPYWVPPTEAEKINNQASVATAQIATFYTSTGVIESEADRKAASTVAATALGAAGGALLVGAPLAGVGALTGLAIAAPLAPVLTPIGFLPAAGVGAGIGALTLGGAGAVVGAGLGGVTGFAAATALGAGTNNGDIEFELPFTEEPAAAPAPAPIVVDAPAITAATAQTVAQVESVPGGTEAIETVRTAVADVPPAAQQAAGDVRAAVLDQPGGEQIVAAADQAAADVNTALAGVSTPVFDALAAVQAGLVPA